MRHCRVQTFLSDSFLIISIFTNGALTATVTVESLKLYLTGNYFLEAKLSHIKEHVGSQMLRCHGPYTI